jgi:hypothetical protein
MMLRRSNSGYSLLEVLMGLGCCVLLIPLASACIDGIRGGEHNRERLAVASRGAELMDWIVGLPFETVAQFRGSTVALAALGDSTFPRNEFSDQARLSIAEPHPDLLRLELKIPMNATSRTGVVTFLRFRARP